MNMIEKVTRLGLVAAIVCVSCSRQPPQRMACQGGQINPNTGACEAATATTQSNADSGRIAALETRLANAENNTGTADPRDRQRELAQEIEIRRLQAIINSQHATQAEKQQAQREIRKWDIAIDTAGKIISSKQGQKLLDAGVDALLKKIDGND